MLITDVSWRERYVSSALNRKGYGITPKGCYKPVTLEIVGLKVTVDDTDCVYVAERNGYSIAVHGTVGTGDKPEFNLFDNEKNYLVIDAFYGINAPTTAKFALVNELLDHHCLVADFIVQTGEVVSYSMPQVPTLGYGLDMGTLDQTVAPYIYPAFTAFGFDQATILEVGDSIAQGPKLFSWATSARANIKTGSLSIVDIDNGNVVIAADLINDGQEEVSLYEIIKTEAATHAWRISALNTKNAPFTKETQVEWRWPVFSGISELGLLTGQNVLELAEKELLQTPEKLYVLPAGGYKWICYPVSMGLRTSFVDVDTGFDVAMSPVKIVSVTNSFGVTADYYTHRSFNTLGGAIKINIS